MSESFTRMVRYLAEDYGVSDDDLHSALIELDEEFAASDRSTVVSIERFRLRKVLMAVARQRGLGAAPHETA
ncbi:hypothetical protein [Pararhizobium haloflavum]|uniref:hypothetical protein n=1 Tax=Pararhizobium haloflavum TaxID=2037914 RepID=UPI0012FFD7D0|nr:hypothetical protein [Pararhizobium haloflavum]